MKIQPLGLFLQWAEYATMFHIEKQWHKQLLLYSPRNSIYRTHHNLEVQVVYEGVKGGPRVALRPLVQLQSNRGRQ